MCAKCLEMAKHQWLICPECKKLSPIGKTHDSCKTDFGLDGLICLYKYRGVVRKLITKLKYGFASNLADSLALAASQRLENIEYLKKPIIVPIPLFRVRKNWRGFNQTEEIGKKLAKNLNWQFNSKLLERIKPGIPQVGLTHLERARNISGEFAVNTEYLTSNPKLKQSTLILFDDVWTTGATIKEACRVLKTNGIENVWGLVVAR